MEALLENRAKPFIFVTKRDFYQLILPLKPVNVSKTFLTPKPLKHYTDFCVLNKSSKSSTSQTWLTWVHRGLKTIYISGKYSLLKKCTFVLLAFHCDSILILLVVLYTTITQNLKFRMRLNETKRSGSECCLKRISLICTRCSIHAVKNHAKVVFAVCGRKHKPYRRGQMANWGQSGL